MEDIEQAQITEQYTDLNHYKHCAEQIEQQKNSRDYPRVTVHDINNSLAKINNALWLMAQESSPSTPLFRTCQQIVEKELEAARKQLDQQDREQSPVPA